MLIFRKFIFRPLMRTCCLVVSYAYFSSTPVFSQVQLMEKPKLLKTQNGNSNNLSFSKKFDGNPEAAGSNLRLDIDKYYRDSEKSGALKPSGAGVNDISSIVGKYIAPGMPIDTSQAILLHAGFVLNETNKNLVEARIDRFKPIMFGEVSVVARLYIENNKGGRSVSRVQGQIYINML